MRSGVQQLEWQCGTKRWSKVRSSESAILNIGRRKAIVRIGHLLCEFALRLEFSELGKQTEYELPITQEQLADAVALTAVHVNRTLMKLEADGYISRSRRHIVINDWHKLAVLADFQPRYLHLGMEARN